MWSLNCKQGKWTTDKTFVNNHQIIWYLTLCSPDQMGLLDPATSDGRVIFFLPWLKHTIAGTTDLPCEVTHNPKPTEDEILFILEEVKNCLNPDVEGMLYPH